MFKKKSHHDYSDVFIYWQLYIEPDLTFSLLKILSCYDTDKTLVIYSTG